MQLSRSLHSPQLIHTNHKIINRCEDQVDDKICKENNEIKFCPGNSNKGMIYIEWTKMVNSFAGNVAAAVFIHLPLLCNADPESKLLLAIFSENYFTHTASCPPKEEPKNSSKKVSTLC